MRERVVWTRLRRPFALWVPFVGAVLFFHRDLQDDPVKLDREKAHERVHPVQQKRWLLLPWLYLYLLEIALPLTLVWWAVHSGLGWWSALGALAGIVIWLVPWSFRMREEAEAFAAEARWWMAHGYSAESAVLRQTRSLHRAYYLGPWVTVEDCEMAIWRWMR